MTKSKVTVLTLYNLISALILRDVSGKSIGHYIMERTPAKDERELRFWALFASALTTNSGALTPHVPLDPYQA
jgi:hypothetical protein